MHYIKILIIIFLIIGAMISAFMLLISDLFEWDGRDKNMEKNCLCKRDEYSQSRTFKHNKKQIWIEACGRIINGTLKYGFVYNDHNCETYLPFEYNNAYEFSEGCAAVNKNGKWGFIDTKGNVVIPYKFDGVTSFKNGIAAFQLNGLWGFMSLNGKPFIQAQYTDKFTFIAEVCFVKKTNGKWIVINKKGNPIDNTEIDEYLYSSCGGIYPHEIQSAWITIKNKKKYFIVKNGRFGFFDDLQPDSIADDWLKPIPR